MAAIDYFGNVIRITSEGTISVDNLRIESLYIWTLDTTASLVVVDANSTGAQILRYSTTSQLPQTDWTHLRGWVGRLTFSTVTACTAWIIKQ